MPQPDTKTRILDSAERLFARDGFHNTSLRVLTQLADVNLAAVNYHFGTKEALLRAVIEHRLLPLNHLRRQQLEQEMERAQRRQQRPQPGDLLRAFILPTLEFRNSGPGAEAFIALIGRSWSEADETVRNCFLELALPNFQLLFESLRQALPELPAAVLFARLQFTMGTMSQVMCMSSRSIPRSGGFPEPLRPEELIQQLLTFVQAGLEAPQ